jgi:threonyl-tRNA synthetase
MNCPHHHMIYERLVQSYRDLPLRLAEGEGLYRKELSGALTGLIRVRGPITQNDSHIYVAPAQLKEEFLKVLQHFKDTYDAVGVGDYWYRLSLPDFSKNKYGGAQQKWEEASRVIRESLNEFGAKFVEAEGEAAFYGPKLDVQINSVTGKEDTIATAQVDVLVPERMGLTYADENNQDVHPIIIHSAILGSYERFMAFLIEQTAGNFPVWFALPLRKPVSVWNSMIVPRALAKRFGRPA